MNTEVAPTYQNIIHLAKSGLDDAGFGAEMRKRVSSDVPVDKIDASENLLTKLQAFKVFDKAQMWTFNDN